MPGGVCGIGAAADASTIAALSRVRTHVHRASCPLVRGNAAVEGGGRQRRTIVYGVAARLARGIQHARGARPVPARRRLRRGARASRCSGAKLRARAVRHRQRAGRHACASAAARFRGHRRDGAQGPDARASTSTTPSTSPPPRALELFNREGLIEIDVAYDARVARPGGRRGGMRSAC
ncbi:MAG: hypothetical protein MZV49_08795 [Rhodopseudomonas palustris]|nr:hypothetical protein [Rhodopseudomonas palustris]